MANPQAVNIISLILLDDLLTENGFKMATDDGELPERGYLRPLMIVVVDTIVVLAVWWP